MELVVLGSGAAVPSARRAAPGFLLRAGVDAAVLDTGWGTMDRLLAAGVGLQSVSHLLYTHNHLDHTAELAPWLFASRVPTAARAAPLTICGSAGFMRMLSSLRSLYGHWLDAASYPLRLVTMDGSRSDPVAFEGWTARAYAVSHIESSVAFRITNDSGKSLVYTGDSAACDELVEAARDADLLLIEASSPDGDELPGHMTPSEAGAIASRAGARRVLLTHLTPTCDGVDMLAQLRRTYDGEAAVAEDGMRLQV